MPNHMLVECFMIQLPTTYRRHPADEIRRVAGHAGSKAEDLREQLERRSIDLKARGHFVESSVRTDHARFESMLRRPLQLDRACGVASSLLAIDRCDDRIAIAEAADGILDCDPIIIDLLGNGGGTRMYVSEILRHFLPPSLVRIPFAHDPAPPGGPLRRWPVDEASDRRAPDGSSC